MQAETQLPTTPPLSGVDMVALINGAIQTIATDFAGDSDPAAKAWPYCTWAHTSEGAIKRRNEGNTAWVVEGRLLRNHVPVYAADELPTSDIGPIFIVGSGPAEWDGTTYKVLAVDEVTWQDVGDKPVTATRWPVWDEVESKPSTFPPSTHNHTWGQISGAPATATRWPTWDEVSGKPSIPPAVNVPATIAGMGVGSVGSYALLVRTTQTATSPGGTVAGSGLRYTSAYGQGEGGAPGGSWRCMGATSTIQGSLPITTVWLRYA